MNALARTMTAAGPSARAACSAACFMRNSGSGWSARAPTTETSTKRATPPAAAAATSARLPSRSTVAGLPPDEPVKRPYRSALRQERSRATRNEIVEAASRLFAEQGFGPTSIDAIAAAAGVGRATVFTSAGGKADLLRAAYELAVRGDDDPVPLGAREDARAILAEPDPHRLLGRYAEVIVGIGRRFGPLHETLRGAAQTDAELRAFFTGIGDERHRGGGRVVRAAAALGPLRAGLTVATATDLLWVLTDPGLHVQLVGRRRWSERRFGGWLADAMTGQLLPPH